MLRHSCFVPTHMLGIRKRMCDTYKTVSLQVKRVKLQLKYDGEA